MVVSSHGVRVHRSSMSPSHTCPHSVPGVTVEILIGVMDADVLLRDLRHTLRFGAPTHLMHAARAGQLRCMPPILFGGKYSRRLISSPQRWDGTCIAHAWRGIRVGALDPIPRSVGPPPSRARSHGDVFAGCERWGHRSAGDRRERRFGFFCEYSPLPQLRRGRQPLCICGHRVSPYVRVSGDPGRIQWYDDAVMRVSAGCASTRGRCVVASRQESVRRTWHRSRSGAAVATVTQVAVRSWAAAGYAGVGPRLERRRAVLRLRQQEPQHRGGRHPDIGGETTSA